MPSSKEALNIILAIIFKKKYWRAFYTGWVLSYFVLFCVSSQFGNSSHLRGANKEYHKLGFYKSRSKCILNKQQQFTDGQTHHTPSTDHLRRANGEQAWRICWRSWLHEQNLPLPMQRKEKEREENLKKIRYPKQNQKGQRPFKIVHHNRHSQILCLRTCTETIGLKSNLTVWTKSF